MKTLGLIVNPIAGMGGAVGLKGTDGRATLRKAISLGAKPVAPVRAELFLSILRPSSNEIRLLAGAGVMGEFEAKNAGFSYIPVGEAKDDTGPRDTKGSAEVMIEKGIDLLVFCGGDGTARDLMDVADGKLPVLGVPTGVKMHSAVFAINPEMAARTAASFLFGELPIREAEVMDVDEEAFRQGRLSARLYGYMLVPYEPEAVQSIKVASPVTESEVRNQAAIAVYVIENVLEPEVIYILGPGTTTRTVVDLLGQKKTLLGVDLLSNKRIMAHDVNEKEILDNIRGQRTKIIVTPVGGQGFIFGRGNQQISPSVIRSIGKENIIVIATKHKLRELGVLRVDTGESTLDNELRGYMKVIADYNEMHLMPVK